MLSEVHISRFLICVLLPCLGFGCQSAVMEFDEAEVHAEVLQTLQDYATAVSEKGLLGEFPYLDNSDEFFWVPPGYLSRIDYDSVESHLNRSAGQFSSVLFEWNDLKIYPLAQNLASYTGQVTSRMTDLDGSESSFPMLETGIMRKRADGWKIMQGQSRMKDQPAEQFSDCDGDTQAAMTACYEREFTRQDSILTDLYGQLIAKTQNDDRQSTYRKSQKAWLAMRLANSEIERVRYSGGSMQRMQILASLVQDTKERITFLRRMLEQERM